MIFSLGGLFALYEEVHKLGDPHQMTSPGVAIGILLVGIALESYSLRSAVHEASTHKGNRSWWQYIRRAKEPELPVVLLEDLGALLGLAVALGGVGLATWTGNGLWDAVGSIGIGALLIGIAVVLAIEMKRLLIAEAADEVELDRILEAMQSVPTFGRLIHLKTQHIGPDELLVGAKVELDASLDFAGVAHTIDELESAIRARVPIARRIHLEPDLYRPRPSDSVDE